MDVLSTGGKEGREIWAEVDPNFWSRANPQKRSFKVATTHLPHLPPHAHHHLPLGGLPPTHEMYRLVLIRSILGFFDL